MELGRREMKQVKAYIDETSGLEQIMLNVASVPLNMIGGIAATVDNATRLIEGKGLNPYSRANALLSTGNYIRSNTAQEIDAATGNKGIPGLGFTFGDAYQAGMSMVDSLVGAKIGGKAYQAVMSMGAASSEMARLYSQGASTEQMILSGVAAGAAEWVFEKYSIENLISMKSPETLGQFLKNAFIQGGIEMSEEAATEFANIITNGLIMQSESDWAKTLEANGGNYGKAIAEMAIQIANAGLGGFLSGMGSGSIQQGMQYGAQQQENKKIGSYISGAKSTDDLIALAMDMVSGESGKAQKNLKNQIQRIMDDGFLTKGGKNKAVGRLYNTVQSVITEQNIGEISSALQEKGFSKKDATAIAGALAVQTNGIALTEKQEKVLDKFRDNADVKSVVSEILGNEDSGINQRSRSLANFEFGAMRNHIQPQMEQSAPGQENEPAADMVDAENESDSESHYEVSVEGKTILKSTGEIVNIKEVADTSNGQMTLRLDNGSTVNAEDVSFSSAGEALVYETVAQMGASVKAANILVNQFKATEGMDAAAYAQGISEAFRYGKMGIEISKIPEDSFARKLNAGQLEYAHRQGERVAGKQVAKEQATVRKNRTVAENATAGENNRSYKATLAEGIEEKSLTESQKASYRLADQIAAAAKVNIRVYDGKTGEHGYYAYETDEIYLNLNATNKSRKSMMAFTLGHELVHRAKAGSPAKYKQFANFLVEQYVKQDSDIEAMIGEQLDAANDFNIKMTEEEAFEEVVCDACQRMLLDTDAGKKLAEFGAQSKQNKSFLDDLKRWITEFMEKLRSIFAGVEPDSLAAQEFAKFDESVKKILADMYVDMTIDAGEHLSTIQNAFGKGTVVEANAQGEFTMANSQDGSKKVFNLVTWENGGRETMEATLLREGYTAEEVKAALTIMDGKHQLVKDLEKQFPEQRRINQATITTDLKDGHSVLSALVSNGDYPVNIDLLMVCKKRKAYQRVINRLCETGMIQQATVDALAIAEINKILGKYGFETACLGCFVESRRLRIQEWAQTICKEWNAEVKKRNPNAKAFGFGKGEAKLTPDEVMKLIGELESGGDKNDQGNLNLGQGSAVKRMGVLLDKVPSLRKTLSIEDLITPDGLSSLRRFDSNLFSMVKSRYGSNSPKFVQEFNPYNHEIAKYGKVPSEYKSLREYLYAIGGARMQSFSDFIVENWFDYCQIVADLSARKLPMHTYTKEIALAKLLGMTGIKINMSLIPDIDRSLGKDFAGLTRNEKGELELIWADKDRFKKTRGKSYMQSINFADAMALQEDPRYSANVGTIAIGVSDKQIIMMLDDARIRMVIPYHSSGMNPIFADLMGTSFYKDYTMVQNTTVKQVYNSKGQKVTLELDKTQTGKLTSGFQFNKVLQELGDARAAAQAYKDWCADASKHTITIKGETYTAELTPKFDDFSWHENYYKLLEDFNTYDCISEQAAPQGDVQQIYPEDFNKILEAELKAQEGHRQKQVANQAFDKAMGEIEDYLKNHTKADTVFYAEQHGVKLSAKDKKLGAEDKKKLAELRKGVKYALPKVEKMLPSEEQMMHNIRDVAYMDSVYDVDGKKLNDSGQDPKRIFGEFFDSLGGIIHSDAFGDISLNKASINSDYGHGRTAAKIASIEAIPNVIQNGKIINWFEKTQNVYRITVAAPIKIGKDMYYMGVMLLRDSNIQRLYLHDVVIEKEVSDLLTGDPSTLGTIKRKKNLSVTSLLDEILFVKHKEQFNEKYMDAVKQGDMETAQRLVNVAARISGYIPVIRYHQTGNKFTQFSTGNPVAGLNDSETPNGIFFKTNDHDIGIGGNIQMQLYLKTDNILHFANRKEANAWYCENVPGYDSLQKELEKALQPYLDKIDAITEQEWDENKSDEEIDGFSYSDRKDAYLNGEVSASDLRKILIEVGGYDEDDADAQIEAYDWEAQGYEGATVAAVRNYNEHCAVVNVPKDVYLYIRSFSNNTENDVDEVTGKTINYSAMKKIMAEIDAQSGLSPAQKTAIARSLGWSEKNINKYKLW